MGTSSGQAGLGWLRPSQLIWKLSDRARQHRERKILTPEQAMGRKGEDLAHRYLERAGMRIMARNYRPSGGEAEVDIVARDGDALVFVEVKSRATSEFGDPDRAIGSEKQKNIVRAARTYATRSGTDWEQVRFDTVSVVFAGPPVITHLKDAFFER